jgi:hypothetical protein
MSLKALVENAVDLAFDIVGDLATPMYFICESDSEYDPNTSQVVVKTCTSSKFMGILGKATDVDLTSQGITAVPEMVDVTVKRKDIPKDYQRYDTINANGVDHRIIHYVDDGYTIKFYVSTR